MEKKKPSEVFLRLWRYHTTACGDATPADFALCAEAWAEIRKMEDRSLTLKTTTLQPLKPLDHAALREEVNRYLLESFGVRAGGPTRASAPTEGTADSATEEPPEPEILPPAVPDQEIVIPPREKTGGVYHGYMASKKNATRERLLTLRASGKASIGQLKELSRGALSEHDLLDMLEAKPVAIAKYDVLAGILDAMEGSGTE